MIFFDDKSENSGLDWEKTKDGYILKHTKHEKNSIDKHPLLTHFLQAELIVAVLVSIWFLVNFIYQFTFALRWDIPFNYIEVNLLETKWEIIVSYFIGIFLSYLLYKNTPKTLYWYTISIIIISIIFVRIAASYGRTNTTPAYQSLANTLTWLIPIIIIFAIIGFEASFEKINKTREIIFKLASIYHLIIVPVAAAFLTFTFHPIYINGIKTNQVLITTYRDYYLVGYYDGNKLFPCYQLIEMVDQDKLETIKGAENSNQRVNVYNKDEIMLSNQTVQLELSDKWTKEQCTLKK